jgi:hypothetical protein
MRKRQLRCKNWGPLFGVLKIPKSPVKIFSSCYHLFVLQTGVTGAETVARAIYRGRVSQYPGRLVKLRDRARILARSDRPETMP